MNPWEKPMGWRCTHSTSQLVEQLHVPEGGQGTSIPQSPPRCTGQGGDSSHQGGDKEGRKGLTLTGWLKGFGSEGLMWRWAIIAWRRSLSLASWGRQEAGQGRSHSAKVTMEELTAWRSCHEPPDLVWTGSNPQGVPLHATF